MRTDQLIDALAAAAGPVDRRAPMRQLLLAAAAGLALAGVLMLALLGLNPALADDAQQTMFWAKLAFIAAAVSAGLLAAHTLARPGAPLARPAWLVAAPFAALWLFAGTALWLTAPGERTAVLMGDTWQACPLNVALLSAPALALALRAMRGLAPTRLRLAGAAAGLLAGAIGALAYTLHCPELTLPFIGAWYVLGMAIPVTVGAAVGTRVLQW
jgi:hypothetical protein